MSFTISKRLAITLGLAVTATIFVGMFGIFQLKVAQARFEEFQDDITQAVDHLNQAVTPFFKLRLQEYRFAVTEPIARPLLRSQMKENEDLIASILNRYEKEDVNTDDGQDGELLKRDRVAFVALLQMQEKYLNFLEQDDVKAAYAMQGDDGLLRATSLAFEGALERHVKYNVDRGVRSRMENAQSYRRSIAILSAVIIGAALIAGLLGIRLQRAIRVSLTSIRDVIERARSNLDLTGKVAISRMDEIGQTADAFNGLQERVHDALVQVERSASSVASASREIASGNADLSARTEQQAASLEETAASMTQLTETVRQNAESATQASALATSAVRLADAGNVSVNALIEAIQKISDGSAKISDITGVIEGIAFQTNILALNAAVEAARAGEQGRGFAVVASEVRLLAQRSSTAAKEIKALIESSATSVQEGTVCAGDAGKTIDEVRLAIERVSQIVSEMAIASEEQHTGIEQIGRAVVHMDEVTQQNAALVEQAAAAAQSLEQQACVLSHAVSQFRVSSDTEIIL
ncbi:Methyl-accepting chemotaxis protein I serine chemoreceptor protein [Paraburkholderia caribensis MBA4]|uniref:Methyl-accepting chemotaxis protein I serine chemoreceptor protein n=1 Tax=Paraburkholderia caribensis MBA4 TaxID=1323664 RepID=A0A0N7JV85_9BURK|nr:methyl-accepting chemotaxis protein [Paraburkholderia caribensis]ALL68509.1 Methyl-accepting chemotaxis protein I serine chemoreceptor protein [Paraburkholderia caribensis MBA4]